MINMLDGALLAICVVVGFVLGMGVAHVALHYMGG